MVMEAGRPPGREVMLDWPPMSMAVCLLQPASSAICCQLQPQSW